MNDLVAAVSGLLLVAGAVAVVAGALRIWSPAAPRRRGDGPAELWARLSHRPAGRRGRRRDLVLLASLLAGFAVATLTGWLLALAVAPALALGLPYLLTMPRARDVELMEALDRWIRSLAATIGTGKSVTDAIRISRRTAPPLLADELGVLVARLNNRWDTREALMRFADALDSPDADGVVAALILAAERGANGASITLHALADTLQDQLRGRRVIETERAKPYLVVRQITVITMATLALVWTVQPQFFAAYKTSLGQLILGVLATLYLGSLILLRRKARPQLRERILVSQPHLQGRGA